MFRVSTYVFFLLIILLFIKGERSEAAWKLPGGEAAIRRVETEIRNRTLNALDEKKRRFAVTDLEIPQGEENTAEILRCIKEAAGLHPEYFYVSNVRSYYFDSSNSYITRIEIPVFRRYLMEEGKMNWKRIKEDQKIFGEKLLYLQKLISPDMDDIQKMAVLHDFLIRNTEYGESKHEDFFTYSVFGPMLEGTGVCQAYAETLCYLASRIGIECQMVTSEALNHAFNIVKLSKGWYFLDATFDDPMWMLFVKKDGGQMVKSLPRSGYGHYGYFMKNFDEMVQAYGSEAQGGKDWCIDFYKPLPKTGKPGVLKGTAFEYMDQLSYPFNGSWYFIRGTQLFQAPYIVKSQKDLKKFSIKAIRSMVMGVGSSLYYVAEDGIKVVYLPTGATENILPVSETGYTIWDFWGMKLSLGRDQVTAYFSDSDYAQGNYLKAFLLKKPKPRKPIFPVTGLTAKSTGIGRVTLTWDAHPEAEQYLIYRLVDGKLNFLANTKSLTYTDSRAPINEFGFYWVFPSVHVSGSSFLTGPFKTYVYAKGIPSAVEGLAAGSTESGAFLRWDVSRGAAGYSVFRKTAEEKNYTYISTLNKATSYTDTGIKRGKWYFYIVLPYQRDKSGRVVHGAYPAYVYARKL